MTGCRRNVQDNVSVPLCLNLPNNPVERAAHSGSFFPCARLYLSAAAHRERLVFTRHF
jgi:hypothetical protein